MEAASLARLFQIARFKSNFKADEGGVHPLITPSDSFGRPENDLHALSVFIDEIKMADDDDYGDFMRRVNVYLLRLRETLRTRTPEVLKTIDAIQLRVQLHPDWSLVSTRPWLLSHAYELREIVLKAARQHRQAEPSALAKAFEAAVGNKKSPALKK
jgi:hypothetical protein